jgi:hypothetical protein
MFYKFLTAAVMMACVALVSNSAQAQIGAGNYPNHLFAQYTTQGQGGLTAGKYIAPHPIPSNVGHSYRTYEPLMPHEMLYEHDRNYFNYYNDNSFKGGGPSLNVTSVRWQNGHQGYRPGVLTNNYIAKLHYGLAQRAYGMGGGATAGGQLLGKLKSKCASGRCGGGILSGHAAAGCSTCAGN